MKRALRLGWLVLLIMGMSIFAYTEDMGSSRIISIDNLLRISSVAGAPQWHPDGKQIIFASNLSQGGLMSLDPKEKFPVRLPLNLGGTGHFLVPNQPKISPDGRWIAYVSNKAGAPEIWLWSFENGHEVQLTNLGGRINALSWSMDSSWIAFSCDRYGNFDIWKVEIPEGRTYRLTDDTHYEVYPVWTPDSQKIIYVRLDKRWLDHDVIEISSDGRDPVTLFSDSNFFDYRWGQTFGYPLISPDGKSILFRSYRSGWINYWIVPVQGGEPKQMASEAADQSEACWSPDGEHIAYISNHNGTLDLRMVAREGGTPRVLAAPEMGVCRNPDWSPDGKSICYSMGTPTMPADLFSVAVDSGESKQLTYSHHAGNLEKALISAEKIQYRSDGGLTISAYLYKPSNIRSGERFPGVLWIHGGPTSQFMDTFQPHVQFFAQRGYVVLLPNIRGSSGYGREFEDANNGCWGQCDLLDVIAGVDYLKSLAYVDPDKMGITGTSYGGIMSMAAVVFAPGVFKAAIPCSGYGDWIWACQHAEYRHVQLWEYEIGPWRENIELYRKLSPINSVQNITTPTFLIHGEGKYPGSEQSRLFAEEMEKYYKVFRYKAYPNENYYVMGLENRRQMLLDMLDFFEQFLVADIY
jgi:dipeptidyl aminopeptidase/acylaminoacyl peptidase